MRPTETSTRVRRRSKPEGINVTLHRRRVDTLLPHLLAQEVRVVDPLSSRKNLLPAHEEVVRVRVVRVLRIGHGVERANGQGELVKDEVVRLELVLDDPTESLLIGRREVLVVLERCAGLGVGGTVLSEEGDGLLELKADGLLGDKELLRRELLADGGNVGGVGRLESLEDVEEEIV